MSFILFYTRNLFKTQKKLALISFIFNGCFASKWGIAYRKETIKHLLVNGTGTTATHKYTKLLLYGKHGLFFNHAL